MIVITVGKNALPPGVDQDKYLEDFRAAFKADAILKRIKSAFHVQ